MDTRRFLAVVALGFLCAGALFAQQGGKPEPVLNPKDGAPGARWPSLSPDGKTVVFTLHGDIWSMPFGGGRATRLNLNDAYETRPLVTPDGKSIVFISDRTGSYDIFLMPIDGGEPKRLTYHASYEIPTGFTADGKQMLFQSYRTNESEIYRMPLEGGTPTQLTFTGARDASTPDDGTTLYFVSGASDSKVQEYKGSANDRLYRQDGASAPKHLLMYEGNSREPRVSTDGKRMYFTREIDGSFELFRCDTDTQTCEQLTSLGEDGLSMFSLSDDENTIVFVWKFYLWSLDLSKEGAKPKRMKITIREDSPAPEVITRTFSSGAERIDLSRDGKWITFELGGDIWIVGADGGNAWQITSDANIDGGPRLSPDNRTIAFYSSTRSGNSDIWLINTDGTGLRQLTTHAADDFYHNWSPDGQSLVFCSERSGNRDIWVKKIDGSAAVQLTFDAASDDDPCFSPDGSMIAFDSGRGGNADIYVMNADGGSVRRVYGSIEVEEVPAFSPDSRFLTFNRYTRTATDMIQEVIVTDLQGSGEVRVAAGHSGMFTPSGKEILYLGGDGRMFYAPAPAGIHTGRAVPFVVTRTVSEKAEMLAAFDEAWQSFGMMFYDPNFHGKDWNALGRQYRALVEAAGCREEYLYYLNRMVGELSASHSGAFAMTTKAEPYDTGLLGLTLEPETFGRGRQRMKVVAVEKGGPADQAWIREGDYIFRVNREAIAAGDNFYRLLEGTTGKTVSLYVADNPEGENFREVTLTPESPMAKRQRDYQKFVTDCKKRSAISSRGQVAYIHIPAMNQTALMNFQNELASPQVQAASGLVIDVRNNGGGNIHQQLIDILSRRPYAQIRLRDGRAIGQPTLHWDRPIVVLINERSYSDAEVFPHAMKTLGMATIVGVPTPGAVIGTRDITLSDGTNWRLPSSGFFNIDGTNQEGRGCQPDYFVEISPEDKLADRDPQLDKAIEILQEQIKAAKKKSKKPAEEKPAPATEGEFRDAIVPDER